MRSLSAKRQHTENRFCFRRHQNAQRHATIESSSDYICGGDLRCLGKVASKHARSQKVHGLDVRNLLSDLPPDSSLAHSRNSTALRLSAPSQPASLDGVLGSGRRLRIDLVGRLQGRAFGARLGNYRKPDIYSACPLEIIYFSRPVWGALGVMLATGIAGLIAFLWRKESSYEISA